MSPEKTKQGIYRQTEGYNQQVQAVMVRVMIHSDQDLAPFLVLSDLIDRVYKKKIGSVVLLTYQ